METVVLIGLIVVLVIRWLYIRERFDEIEERIRTLTAAVNAPPMPAFPIAAPARPAAGPVTPPPAPDTPRAAPQPPAPAPTPRPADQVSASPPAPPSAPRPPRPAPPPPLPQPVFATATAAAPQRSSEEWETVLGGNWLNKLGVFVLVIGIALALGYSFKLLGPAGRVGISIAISLAMLASGVVFERHERYRTFARGLIGGGWAALYFTTYAMQALAPARIIYNPWAGAILLLAVAVGMIIHSLRYRSQTVTGLAYFIAFVTLAITQVTSLSIIALIPLAASLLYVARRFNWSRMAVFGLIATYVTCATRPDLGTPLWQAQTVFAIYWLLFEAFDIACPDPFLLPLNAVGFLGLSIFKWLAIAPDQIWQLLAATAAAYLAGAILRARSDHWRPAITLTAALAAVAIYLKLDHQWIALGLLVEAELFYLAGLRLRAAYLRYLAVPLFGAQLMHLLTFELTDLPVRSWTPIAAFEAVVFYANRFLRSTDLFYGYAAAGMVALVAGYEAPERYQAVAWMLLGLAPFAFGWWRRLLDFRIQGYLLVSLGLVATSTDLLKLPLSVATGVTYGLTLCALLSPKDRFVATERDTLRFTGSLVATLTSAALIWRVVPELYLGLAWMAMAQVLLELGLRGLPQYFSRESYAIAAMGALRVLLFNAPALTNAGPWVPRLIPAGAALLAYALAARARPEEKGRVFHIASFTGSAFALIALWAVLPPPAVAPAWTVFGLALLSTDRLWNRSGLHWQSYLVAAAAFTRCWYINFESAAAPLLAGSAVIAILYACQLLSSRETQARMYFSLLATALTTLLLYYQVTGSLRTVAWGIEGVALLGAGFPLRDRILRLSGLVLLLGCITKLFAWDLRHLDTLPRIFSFIVLGLFLVGVSWAYTRFRERVAQYL